jgi:hypothetical protein
VKSALLMAALITMLMPPGVCFCNSMGRQDGHAAACDCTAPADIDQSSNCCDASTLAGQATACHHNDHGRSCPPACPANPRGDHVRAMDKSSVPAPVLQNSAGAADARSIAPLRRISVTLADRPSITEAPFYLAFCTLLI